MSFLQIRERGGGGTHFRVEIENLVLVPKEPAVGMTIEGMWVPEEGHGRYNKDEVGGSSSERKGKEEAYILNLYS